MLLNQLNLHLEKSISGWAFIKSPNLSFFYNSSLEGSPIYFYLISNIIFSTVPLVSPSKSDNLDGSGLIFYVLIVSCPN